MSEGLW